MNGDVKSYNLNRPMTWEEFRSMPQDLQIMYIKKLRNEYFGSAAGCLLKEERWLFK